MKLTPVQPTSTGPHLRGSLGLPGPGLPVLSATWVILGVATALALLAIAAAPADSRPLATRLAILALGIIAAWRVIGRAGAVTASSPEQFEDALRQPGVAAFEIAALRAVETDVRMATANAFGVEMRLKPVLRDLARWRLQRDYGVDLDRQPDRARLVLGEHLWRLVAPTDAFPEFRAAGVAMADIDAGVDQLEGI